MWNFRSTPTNIAQVLVTLPSSGKDGESTGHNSKKTTSKGNTSQKKTANEKLGGGFKHFFIFTPKNWGNDPI